MSVVQQIWPRLKKSLATVCLLVFCLAVCALRVDGGLALAEEVASAGNAQDSKKGAKAEAKSSKASKGQLQDISSGPVMIVDMDMLILPGTQALLESSIARAVSEGASAIVVKIDTPGGMLQTSQEMVQAILRSPVPVIVYVGPTGATATSAGVFITLAGHIAAMAPSTTIGAATPVMGDGQDIAKDMKAKAENITSAMVRSIAEERGRNIQWAEKAVTEAASLTETEALKEGVIDFVAQDVEELLRKVKGKVVTLNNEQKTLGDLSGLPRIYLEISARDLVVNVLSNPTVLALLWLAATTGISIELYNPGLIFPGVIGVISLLIALAMSQVIPINSAAVILLAVGAILIGAELFTGTLILGVLGVVAMVLGAVYLVNVVEAPGLTVALEFIIPMATLMGLFMLLVASVGYRVMRKRSVTGSDGLVGLCGKAVETITSSGKVFVNGELWNAFVSDGAIEKDAEIQVVAMRPGLTLEVKAKGS